MTVDQHGNVEHIRSKLSTGVEEISYSLRDAESVRIAEQTIQKGSVNNCGVETNRASY